MTVCNGCDKEFQDAETAPYQRNADGTYAWACRGCINEWIRMGFLWHTIPFWARQKGLDKV